MAHIRCSFKAGQVRTEQARNLLLTRLDLRIQGNGWRGVLVIAWIIFMINGLWELGAIALGLALLWSVIENVVRNWRKTYSRQKALRLLNQGRIDEALATYGSLEPNSAIWWRFLSLLLQQQQWRQAQDWLEELEESSERKYLMAITWLGQNRPGEVINLCPSRPEGKWLTLKAEALFQNKEWQKVLGLLRRSKARGNASESIELAWLKGGSYLFLGQNKPAAKLLRYVVNQGSEDYSTAREWLMQAMTKLE